MVEPVGSVFLPVNGVHCFSSRVRHICYGVDWEHVPDAIAEGLDGIGLTSLLRTRSDTRSLPIILVSAREGEDDKRQGLEAGADGYLTKSECVQGRLLRELSGVLEKRRRT